MQRFSHEVYEASVSRPEQFASILAFREGNGGRLNRYKDIRNLHRMTDSKAEEVNAM